MAAPVSNLGTDIQSVITADANTGFLYQESKRDVASFDIDRFRKGTPAFEPMAEDSGFFVQPGTPYADVSAQDPVLDRQTIPANGQPFIAYPQPGQTGGPGRFRLITTMGGYVFGTLPASSGNFTLQVGRLEP